MFQTTNQCRFSWENMGESIDGGFHGNTLGHMSRNGSFHWNIWGQHVYTCLEIEVSRWEQLLSKWRFSWGILFGLQWGITGDDDPRILMEHHNVVDNKTMDWNCSTLLRFWTTNERLKTQVFHDQRRDDDDWWWMMIHNYDWGFMNDEWWWWWWHSSEVAKRLPSCRRSTGN